MRTFLLQLSITFVLACSFHVQLKAQEKCGTMAKHNDLMLQDASYKKAFIEAEVIVQKQKVLRTEGVQGTVYKIPVVVHIMHVGEALGTTSNITDDQVYSAISSLNDAYRKKTGSIYDGNGVDLEIEFCLAQKDPSGSPTTGINRINAASAIGSYGTDGIIDANEFAVKALSKWDNNKYYNIWVVSEIEGNNAGGGVQGYAYYAPAPSSVDGMVVLYNSFGYDPEGSRGYNLKAFTNKNTTTIHEVGHSIGLYHTFEGDKDNFDNSICPPNTNCSTTGDMVCDTPPHKRSSSNCTTGLNECDNNSSRELFIHNYMDYSSDECQTEFTAGQAARARTVLTTARAGLISAANIAACGCNSNTAPIARFYANDKEPCGNNPITFIDESINAPASYAWTFQGGAPATSTVKNPTVVFSGAGPYNVSLTVKSASSQTNTKTKTAYISPVSTYSGAFPMTESFEGAFPPANWQVISSDANVAWGTDGTKQWDKRTVVGSGAGTSAAAMNLYHYNIAPRTDDMVMPLLNFSDVSASTLSFSLAYRFYSINNSDTLKVLASVDCGKTFTEVYKKGGMDLTVGLPSQSDFSPANTSDWRTENINLSAFAGQYVELRFRTINDYGNNLYIDNVNIAATYNAPVANFNASKTAGIAIAENVTFTNTSSGTNSTYAWNFGLDATPASATGIGPHAVSYTTSGSKTVSLTVTGLGGTDDEIKTNYIAINPAAAPIADFTASKTTGLDVEETVSFTSTATGDITVYTWNFGADATPETATGVGPHDVTYATYGQKTVSLSITGPDGDDIETKANYILINGGALEIQSAETLNIKVYPNPTKDIVYIDLQDQEEVSVEVVNTLSNKVLVSQAGHSSLTVDLSAQPQGMYLLVIKTAKGNIITRVAKTN